MQRNQAHSASGRFWASPISVHVVSASPHEVTLVERTRESRFVEEKPKRLIENRAYDSDLLDAELGCQGIEMIAPHRGTGGGAGS